jgi:hypothetical protein
VYVTLINNGEMGPGGGHGPPSTLKKNLIINVKKKKVFCLLAPCKKKNLAPWPPLFYHLFNWFHLIWNDSFIVKTFSFNISRVATDMPKKVTIEGTLQSCRSFVQSKWKEFSKAVHWKKTSVDLRSHMLDKARFPKDVWQK